MESNNFYIRAKVRNNILSVTFTDRKSGLSFGIMSKNPEKIKKWLKNHLTK